MSKRQYARVCHSGQRYTGNLVVIDFRQGKSLNPKLGITVTKRFGDAHRRNRFKRIVREAFRLSCHQFPIGFEVNVRPRTAADNAKTQDIQEELIRFLQTPQKKICDG